LTERQEPNRLSKKLKRVGSSYYGREITAARFVFLVHNKGFVMEAALVFWTKWLCIATVFLSLATFILAIVCGGPGALDSF